MSQNGSHLPQDLLDLYLDNQLDERQRLIVEQALQNDPMLRRQIEAQRMIDSSLSARFSPPVLVPPLPQVGSNGASHARPQSAPAPQRRRRILLHSKWVAIAAVVMISLATWRIWKSFGTVDQPDSRYSEGRVYRPMDAVYRAEVRNGCKPEWLCRDEREFIMTFFQRLGHGMALASVPPGIEARGLSLTNTITPQSVYLLSKVDGNVVLVFVDRLEKDSPQKLADPSLHLFRKELGPVVMYEVTPYPKPHLLDLMQIRDVPADWKKP